MVGKVYCVFKKYAVCPVLSSDIGESRPVCTAKLIKKTYVAQQ